MDLGLAGKTAVITGASSGIGLSAAQGFLEEGANVVGASRHVGPLEDLRERYEGARVIGVAVDLATPDGPAALVERAMEEFGAVDVLVNNVGISPARSGFLDVSDEDWREVLDINFMSMVRATRAVLPHMAERGSGVIINISSASGRQPSARLTDYAVSKAAMNSLGKALALEFGPKGIRVNTISPGPVRTGLWDRPGGYSEAIAREFDMETEAAIEHFCRVVRLLPLGRIGQPQDVANMILLLASDVTQELTGADIPLVDSLKTV